MEDTNKVIDYALKYLNQQIEKLAQEISDGVYLPEETEPRKRLEALINERKEITKMKFC